MTSEDILVKIQDEKFKGNCVRIDGKKITETQVKNVVSYYFNYFYNRRRKIRKKKKKTLTIPVKTD